MTLHIFNPEHDIALASGLSNFTAPHAGRQLRHDLGFLPAVWAGEGDCIVVDDVEQAEREWRKLAYRLNRLTGNCPGSGNVVFKGWRQPVSPQPSAVSPWGWNSALRAVLLRRGVSEELLPTMSQLDVIRQLSHRRTAAALLPKLRMEGTVGEAFECTTEDDVEVLAARYGEVVLKAPWSSSGRGVQFYSIPHPQLTVHNWVRRVIAMQGSIMVEPCYRKVKDFGMEFSSDGRGTVGYSGLSLFHTANGAYTGNILATETVKRGMMSRYLSLELLDLVRDRICRELGAAFNGRYQGPFGVDMMVVQQSASGRGDSAAILSYRPHPCPSPAWEGSDYGGTRCPALLLHPCVEINLRQTMGHVALALTPEDDDVRRVMRLDYSENIYKLTINCL